MIHIAILDDYQNVALEMADWSPLAGRAAITVFNDHLSNLDKVVERLLPFEVVCVMRRRTPLPRSVIERLPQLKFIASTGRRNAAIDEEATADRGIVVAHTGYDKRPTIELTWALILASRALDRTGKRTFAPAVGRSRWATVSTVRRSAFSASAILARRSADWPRVRHGSDRLEPESHGRQAQHAERGWSPRRNSSAGLTS